MIIRNFSITAFFLGLGVVTVTSLAGTQSFAQSRPSLVVTSEPMNITPPAPQNYYPQPTRAPEVTPDQLLGNNYYQPAETLVSRKISELRGDLLSLQGRIRGLSEKLNVLDKENQALSAEYYASTATISTQLQSGTTPGNPRLVQRLNVAQQNIEALAQNMADLNTLAVEIANLASVSSFLLEAVRSTYTLSGAVEEDHVLLSQLEDQINSTIVSVDRLLNQVNDDITRLATYLGTERNNVRTLALGVTNGDLYGKSLSNRPFSRAGLSSIRPTGAASPASGAPQLTNAQTRPSTPKPLAKIRFDKANVDYEQAVFIAVSDAMQRYPEGQFELVAVHPTRGNAAQVAIESTKARRNAERVLRSLTQMGLPLNTVDLSYRPSEGAKTNEVHLFIR